MIKDRNGVALFVTCTVFFASVAWLLSTKPSDVLEEVRSLKHDISELKQEQEKVRKALERITGSPP